jgi:hypothetical protein
MSGLRRIVVGVVVFGDVVAGLGICGVSNTLRGVAVSTLRDAVSGGFGGCGPAIISVSCQMTRMCCNLALVVE